MEGLARASWAAGERGAAWDLSRLLLMKAASVISESQQRGIQEAHAHSPLINVALIGLHVCLQQSSKKKDTGWKIIIIIFSQAKRCGKLLSVCFWDGNLIRKWKGTGLSWAKCLGVWSLVLGWTFPQSKITDTKSINLSARKQHPALWSCRQTRLFSQAHKYPFWSSQQHTAQWGASPGNYSD